MKSTCGRSGSTDTISFPIDSKPQEQRVQEDDQSAELRRPRAELKRVTEDRDILKKGRRVLCQGVRLKCAFIKQRASERLFDSTALPDAESPSQ